MSMFRNIMNQFEKVQLNEKSKLSRHEIQTAMDKLCSINSQTTTFDEEVAEQLWEHTTKTP